jgi:hypothetical protein
MERLLGGAFARGVQDSFDRLQRAASDAVAPPLAPAARPMGDRSVDRCGAPRRRSPIVVGDSDKSSEHV